MIGDLRPVGVYKRILRTQSWPALLSRAETRLCGTGPHRSRSMQAGQGHHNNSRARHAILPLRRAAHHLLQRAVLELGIIFLQEREERPARREAGAWHHNRESFA
jgi:hypothetical protein